MTIRVISADDHDAVIAGVAGLLEVAGNIEVVGSARSPSQLMEVLQTLPCDVLVTDFSMPYDQRSDGIQMIEQIRRLYPRVAIVVLTMISNVVVLNAILKHGVLGLCDKAASVDDIADAVRSAARGDVFLSESFRKVIESTVDAAGQPLSAREAEVVRLFGEGLSIAEIASQLNRSKQTVSRQKRDAMAKLGLESDGQLASYARSVGFSP